MDREAEQDHVAAHLGQQLGQEQRHEARVGQDPAGLVEVGAGVVHDAPHDLVPGAVGHGQRTPPPTDETGSVCQSEGTGPGGAGRGP